MSFLGVNFTLRRRWRLLLLFLNLPASTESTRASTQASDDHFPSLCIQEETPDEGEKKNRKAQRERFTVFVSVETELSFLHWGAEESQGGGSARSGLKGGCTKRPTSLFIMLVTGSVITSLIKYAAFCCNSFLFPYSALISSDCDSAETVGNSTWLHRISHMQEDGLHCVTTADQRVLHARCTSGS